MSGDERILVICLGALTLGAAGITAIAIWGVLRRSDASLVVAVLAQREHVESALVRTSGPTATRRRRASPGVERREVPNDAVHHRADARQRPDRSTRDEVHLQHGADG